jgi:hypothetical protein
MIDSTKSRSRNAVNKQDTVFGVLIRHFEVQNRTENKSPRTVEWYNLVLGQLDARLQLEGLSTDIASINERAVRQLIQHLQERPGTKMTILSFAHDVQQGNRAPLVLLVT